LFCEKSQKNINRSKKALILSENYSTKELNEINQSFFFKKEKNYKYKIKKLNLKFDYTQPIDYCSSFLSRTK